MGTPRYCGCLDCGKWKIHHGRGLCRPCHSLRKSIGTLGQRPRHLAGSRDGDAPERFTPLPLADDPGWRQQAVCASVSPDLWFPDKGGSQTPAKTVCGTCPVRAQCLAVADSSLDGVWGGTSVKDRQALRRRTA